MKDKNVLDFSAVEPYCVLKAIAHNLWMVIFAGVIGLLAATMILNVTVTPQYSSSMTLVVSARSGASTYYSDTTAAGQTAATFSELLQSSLMKNIVAKEMGVSSISGSISASQVGDTNLITVTATADNPKEAFLIVKAVENNYAEVSDYISRTAVLRVLDSPSVSTSAYNNSDIKRNAKISGLVCAGLMLVAILWIFISRDTVQNREGAKRKLDARILTVIPHEYDRGKKLVKGFDRRKRRSENLLINAPTRSYGFCESMRMISARLEHEKEKGSSVFMFTSITESEGKSTVSANTAISLCNKGYKVLLIDVDTRKPAQKKLLLKDTDLFEDFGAMFENESFTPEEIVNKAYRIKLYGLDILANAKPYLSVLDKLSSDRMAEIIKLAKKKYDYVIVDTPPMGYFADSEVMSEYVDAAVLVVIQDIVPADDINEGIDSLKLGGADMLGVILNDVRYLFQSNSVYGYGYGYGRSKKGYGYGYGYSNSQKN